MWGGNGVGDISCTEWLPYTSPPGRESKKEPRGTLLSTGFREFGPFQLQRVTRPAARKAASAYLLFTLTMVASANEYSSGKPGCPFVFDGFSSSPTLSVRLYFAPSTRLCAFASASLSHAA